MLLRGCDLMKTVTSLILIAFICVTLLSANAYSQYQVCPETTCFLACPAGDASFCFCINYNGEPLQLHPSQVYMKIECYSEGLYFCPGELNDKPAYLRTDECVVNPECGAEYCWYFQLGGCCDEVLISLHLAGDPDPFYTMWALIKTPDFNGDGNINLSDLGLFGPKVGTTDACYDLNCDGTVDSVHDYAILEDHYLHACDEPIGVEGSTWGSIKSIYKE